MSRVRSDKFTNRAATGPCTFTHGMHSTDTAGTGIGVSLGYGGIVAVGATISGNLSVGGTITYEDTTNVDSTGIVTARNGIKVGQPTGVGATFNPAGDLVVAGVGTFGSIASGAISGSTGTFSGAVNIDDTTASTSTATGALIVDGGVGIAKSLNVAGRVNLGGKVQFTVASPQLEFNNGGPRLWSPSANTLTIHTGGGFDSASSERLRIGSSGEIGIGGANYGTDGQVLTSKGSGAAVQWADAAGGAWELVTSGLVDSGGEYEIIGTTSTLTSSYQMYRLTFYTEQTPSGGESGLQLQIYNGAWREDTNYGYGWIVNGGAVDSQTSAKGILLGKMGMRFEGVVQFSNPSQTTRPKWFSARAASMNSDTGWAEPLNFQVSGQYNGGTKNDAVTGIRLRSIDNQPAGGEGGGQNFSAGYYLLEGCAIS